MLSPEILTSERWWEDWWYDLQIVLKQILDSYGLMSFNEFLYLSKPKRKVNNSEKVQPYWIPGFSSQRNEQQLSIFQQHRSHPSSCLLFKLNYFLLLQAKTVLVYSKKSWGTEKEWVHEPQITSNSWVKVSAKYTCNKSYIVNPRNA
jgi:hypothetical protein